MELVGSQISLATREKIQQPPIYYPPVYIHRPASASLSFHRNRLISRNSSILYQNRRRPLSADSGFNNSKRNSSVKFNLANKNRAISSTSNIFNLLIDEQPMTSKYYWTTTKNNKAEMKLSEQQKQQDQPQDDEERREKNNKDNDSMSCSESIEENVVTIKATNMENENNDANVQTHQHHDTTKSSSSSTFGVFRSPHIKRRPDSLKLSFAYGSTSDLGKSVFSNSDVNQTKSLSVDGNKSHHSGKKSTSYDLWVNENSLKVANATDVEGKKLDLPGRVSFR
ncbi:hypothetical protein PVAND_007351 [Polypedilum vanderplanki]|uniref:Uncharacterized protein n=1 Tax=Polypedilum vanderplanki TaxID=319348 RepID=A0A9J6C6L6_POLVA|nr:hypothetical protein PVAND_007351 [Polypedilum vanderplanki]